MTDPTYTPPKVWTWDKESGGRFAKINRPVAGATHEKALPVGAHPLQLYSLGTPNGVKVTVLLEELLARGQAGAEYDAWYIDINAGDQFSSGFVAVNPNSKIPALLDLKRAGYRFVLVSNQDGLGTESFPEPTFREPQDFVRELFASQGIASLHLLGHAPVNAAGETLPRPGSLLRLLWPALAADHERQLPAAAEVLGPGSPAAPAGPAPVPGRPTRRLGAQWNPDLLPRGPTLQRLQLTARDAQARPEYSWVGLSARAIGTIVHAELQRFAGRASLPAAPDRGPDLYLGWLAELGVPEAERQRAAAAVHEALAGTLADPRGRWILDPAGPGTARSEWRLTGQHEGRLVNVVIDRYCADAEGQPWVIDYKTGTHEGADLEGFIAQEVDRHRAQLKRYAAIVEALQGGPVRTALYFPRLQQFREVDWRDLP